LRSSRCRMHSSVLFFFVLDFFFPVTVRTQT
jgi:hypothetical protein